MRRSVSKARKPSWAPGARPARAPPASARLLSTSRASALCLAPRGRSGPSSAAVARAFSASSWRLAETVKVPQMAESISEGTLKQWVKKKGDYVEADEEVATIETDKIDVSVNAPKAGTITELMAEEEDTVTVGQDLFKLEPGEGGAAKSDGGEEKPKDEGKSSESAEKPKDEGKASEDKPAKEDKPAPKKDDKPPSKSASPPGQQRKKSNAEVEERESEPERPEPKHSQDDKRPAAKSSDEGDSTSKKPPQPKSDENQTPAISKPTGGERKETRVKMNRMRLRIAERLKQSQNTAASLTTFNEIDMSSLMEMRKLYKDAVLKQHGVKLGFMSAFSRAATIALQEIPAANASIENGEQIVYRDYVDLSVAVATPKGLVTPVIRNVETMSMRHIEQAIADAGKKARDGKLTLEDMSGGTFTISNGGVFGSLFGTPIINMPQTAVLGLHAINQRPVVLPSGEIAARPIMIVALTYDHRLLDGREAVTLLVRIKQLIEDPRRMLLDI